MGIKLTQENFIKRSIDKHGNKYIYDKSVIISALIDVLIKCIACDKYFPQKPKTHMSGSGCYDCGRKIVAKARIKDTTYIINEAIKIHGLKYIYDKVIYTGMHNIIIITCREHGDFPQTPSNHINHKQNCPSCAKKTQHDNLRYTEDEVDDLLKIKNIKLKDKYENSAKIINFECLDCFHVWPANFNRINCAATGCPKCNDTKLTNKNVDDYLLNNNIKIKRIDEYIKSNVKINWQCLECDNIWPAMPNEIMRKNRQPSGCPECARGRNEKIVRNFLIENNINYEKITIKLPISKNAAIPDFYIPSMNLIIEYNGIQHYQVTQFEGQTLKDANVSFVYQKIRDEQLREYCDKNNIRLLEIDGREYKGNDLINYLSRFFNKIA